MSGERALPDPRYIDGMEYAARVCDELGRDYYHEPYPGYGWQAAAARGCAWAIRARAVKALGVLDPIALGDVMLAVYLSRQIAGLRQRAITARQRGADRFFFAGMERAAALCDVEGHGYVVEPYPRQREVAAMARCCAEAIRAQARTLSGAKPTISAAETEP